MIRFFWNSKLNLEKKYVSYFKKENIDIKNNKTKNNKYKKKQDNVGVHVFFQNCNHIKA